MGKTIDPPPFKHQIHREYGTACIASDPKQCVIKAVGFPFNVITHNITLNSITPAKARNPLLKHHFETVILSHL